MDNCKKPKKGAYVAPCTNVKVNRNLSPSLFVVIDAALRTYETFTTCSRDNRKFIQARQLLKYCSHCIVNIKFNLNLFLISRKCTLNGVKNANAHKTVVTFSLLRASALFIAGFRCEIKLQKYRSFVGKNVKKLMCAHCTCDTMMLYPNCV